MIHVPMRKLLVLVLAASACGGNPQSTQHPTTLPSATASAAPTPAIDLSPVALPPSAVAVIRISHPAASADMISAWAGQPLDAQGAFESLVGERLSKLADLDAPIDMLVLAKDRGEDREPDAAFAVAASVKNFDAAKAQLEGDYGLLPIGNGAFEIQRRGGHHDGDRDFRVCAIAPGIGSARIVCSRSATMRDDALPYLTRGTGALVTKSDFHVEARPGPFTELVRRERARIVRKGASSMGGDRALEPLWSAAIGDLADGFLDASKATIDATIDQSRGTASLTITATGSRALVTRILSAHPERAEPPPATYFRLPADSDIAFFGHGMDADQLLLPKTGILSALGSAMDDDAKVKPADKTAFLDVLGRSMDLMTVPIVYGRGVDYGKAIAATTGLTESSDAAKIRNGIEQAAGWDVIGVGEKPAKVAAILKDWAALLARPSVEKTMDQGAPKLRAARAPRSAPPGTVAFELKDTHEDIDWSSPPVHGKYKKRPAIVLTLHVLVVPDHDMAWVVTALDEATAAAKAREIVAGTSTLSGRAGIESLKTARLNAGGFFTPRGLGMGLPFTWLVGSPRYKASTDPVLGMSSSTQYTTPLLFTAAEGSAGSERTLTLSLQMPRAALADFLAVGPRIFH